MKLEVKRKKEREEKSEGGRKCWTEGGGNPLAKTTDKIYYFALKECFLGISWSLFPLSFLQLGHSYFCRILISGEGIRWGKVVISANWPSCQVCSGDLLWRSGQSLETTSGASLYLEDFLQKQMSTAQGWKTFLKLTFCKAELKVKY